MADSQSTRSRERDAEPDRTEETVEQWGRRLGRMVAATAARVREEAEDIWAEAQSVRRGERE